MCAWSHVTAAAAGTAPRIWKMSRRLTPGLGVVLVCHGLYLHIQFLDLIGNVVGSAPAEGGNGESGVLVGIADEGCGVGDEQILHVPCLAILVEHGRLGIGCPFSSRRLRE